MVDDGSRSIGGETATAENAASDAYARIQSVKDAERRSFEPSRLLERLVLQILGGWSNVIAEVNFARFSAAGRDSEWGAESKLVKAVRELAEDSRVRWPHDNFTAAARMGRIGGNHHDPPIKPPRPVDHLALADLIFDIAERRCNDNSPPPESVGGLHSR